MALLTPVESFARRELVVYPRAPGGPITVHRLTDRIEAVNTDELAITIAANSLLDGPTLRALLRHGIDVLLGSEVIGVLHQPTDGPRRADRAIVFSARPDRSTFPLPAAARFRARGVVGALSMEVEGRRAVSVRFPAVMWLNAALRHDERVPTAWIVLFAAVSVGVWPAALM